MTELNRLWSLLLCLLLMARTAQGSDAPHLVVYTEYYPPFNYQAEDGTVQGLSTDNVRKVLDASGFSYEIRFVPWFRAVNAVKTQTNALIYTITRTEDREAEYHWLMPVANARFALFARAEEDRAVTWETLKAGEFTAACVANYLSCSMLRRLGMPEANIIRLKDRTTGDYLMVVAGRADIYVSELTVDRYLRTREGYDPEATKPVLRIEGKLGFYLASGLKMPQAVRQKIRAAYETLRVSGNYQVVDPDHEGNR